MPFVGKQQAMQNLRDRADKFTRALGLEALGRLMKKTPVDTGRARANWNVRVDDIDRSTDENATSSDVRARFEEAKAQILAAFGPGHSLFITNSLPYIPALEDGHSSQAPNGMVKVTVAELKPLVSRIAAEVASGQ